jgi:hypothetical protein
VTAGQGGYSGTPLARKLGVKAGHRVVLDQAPQGWRIPDLPDGVELGQPPGGGDGADVVVAFFREAADLVERLPDLGRRIFPDGAVWVAWPRKAGGHTSDILEQTIRDIALPSGLVDVKVAALDQDWSGLRLVWRKELRGGTWPPRPAQT